MLKKQRVKAGVLLYAVTMAAIFSLLLQFYLNRQVAHHQDFALNKEKLVAFAMAKRTKDKVEQESGEKVFNFGQVSFQNKTVGMVTVVRMSKSQYEFLFPSVRSKEDKKGKEDQAVSLQNDQVNQKKLEEKVEKQGNP